MYEGVWAPNFILDAVGGANVIGLAPPSSSRAPPAFRVVAGPRARTRRCGA